MTGQQPRRDGNSPSRKFSLPAPTIRINSDEMGDERDVTHRLEINNEDHFPALLRGTDHPREPSTSSPVSSQDGDLSPRKDEVVDDGGYFGTTPKTNRMRIRENRGKQRVKNPVGHTMSDGTACVRGQSPGRKTVGFKICDELDRSSSPGEEEVRSKSPTSPIPVHRTSSKKNRSKERKQRRDEKRRSGEFHRVGESLEKSFKKLHVSSPGRYRSLRIVHQDSQDEGDSNASGLSTPKLEQSDGNERVTFHRTFQLLIRIGNDKKPYQDSELSKGFSMRGRRGSQVMWPQGREKHDLGEVLWLHLRTYLSGRPMNKAEIVNSTKQYDEWLLHKRESMIPILNAIRNFRFYRPQPSFHSSGSGSECCSPEELGCGLTTPLGTPLSHPHFQLASSTPKESTTSPNSDLLGVPDVSNPVAQPGQQEIFCGAFLQKQRQAMREVAQLLEKYEEFQDLYPTSRTMETLLGEEFDDILFERLNVMYVWLNITRDLCRKIRDIGFMLGMHRPQNASELSVDWPNLDYESPECSRPSSPTELNSTGEADPEDVAEIHRPRSSGSLMSGLSRTTSEHEIVSTAIMYKKFVEKSLRLRGMRKVLQRVGDVTEKTLTKARRALLRPKEICSEESSAKIAAHKRSFPLSPGDYQKALVAAYYEEQARKARNPRKVKDYPENVFVSHKTSSAEEGSDSDGQRKYPILDNKFAKENDPELSKFGVSNPAFQAMCFPSFYPSFLFLLRVPLDLVHEWLKLRVEQKTSKEPDLPALKTLIQDCHDCLEAAVEVKCFYQEHVQATTYNEEQLDKLLVKDLQDFEVDLAEMFKIYLNYVRCWGEIQAKYESTMAEWSQYLFSRLEEEWKFAKKIAINVLSGESDAALKFCQLGNLLFEEMVQNYLESGVRNLGKLGDADEEEEDLPALESSPQSSPVPSLEHLSSDESGKMLSAGGKQQSSVFLACRSFKAIVSEVRERALRSLTFSKLLRSDLEISAKFELQCSQSVLLEQLLENNYVLVTTPHSIEAFMMFCEKSIAANEEHLQLLLNVTCGRDDSEVPRDLAGKSGYLLLVKCEHRSDKRNWKGERKHIIPDADTDMALHFMQVDAVYLVVVNSASLKSQREAMGLHIPTVFLRVVDEQCSCHEIIASNMNELKERALVLRDKIAETLAVINEDLLQERDDKKELDENELQTYRDTLIQAYNFAFEYHHELNKLISAQFRPLMAHGLRSFVMQWCNLVHNTCAKGHGVRPRWASEGLNFLALATSPEFTLCLTDQEFTELKSDINKTIEHVIGHAPFIHSERHRDGYFVGSDTPPLSDGPGRMPQSTSEPNNMLNRAISYTSSTSSTNSTIPLFPSLRPNHLGNGEMRNRSGSESRPQSISAESSMLDLEDPIKRIREKLRKDETKRQSELFRAKKIGRCLDQTKVHPASQIEGKRAAFRWQRLDKKIGEGRFGVVYTAINLETSELMAVKQMKFERHDHRALLALVDEIKNFVGIQHPNLVRYYEFEVHRDDLLIFMEYCDEGTLEMVCREGLDEIYVRQYTHYLLRGIHYLHEKRIVHRDIKPCNIFMTSSREVLKLGDFGSSVRLSNSTTQRGELTDYVGTAAYMAPEVITGGCRMSEEQESTYGPTHGGHGREADIWSLGCVVLEMATGKAPWQGYQYHQIIWKVGNGCSPTVPENLSSGCKDFLSKCFAQKPEKRWNAGQLIEHHFARVVGHEDSLTGSDS